MNRLVSISLVAFCLVICISPAGAQCSRLNDQYCGFLLRGSRLLQAINYGKADVTTPWSVTRDGRIVGTYDDHGYVVAGFLYDDGVYTSFSDPNQLYKTSAYGINNNGYIVGSYDGYKYGEYGSFGFLKVGDVYITLDYPLGQFTEAYGINDAGVIVGRYGDTQSGPIHGFVYHDGSWKTVDYPSSTGFTMLTSINNNGEMVGLTDADNQSFSFLLSNGGFTKISHPGAVQTDVYGINANGVIVGSYWDGTHTKGFSWTQGQFTDITLPGNPPTLPRGINLSNQIVGFTGNDLLRLRRGLLFLPSALPRSAH
jgi:probable HAF family extracellular repeat protein